jgi:hypothetical protein
VVIGGRWQARWVTPAEDPVHVRDVRAHAELTARVFRAERVDDAIVLDVVTAIVDPDNDLAGAPALVSAVRTVLEAAGRLGVPGR